MTDLDNIMADHEHATKDLGGGYSVVFLSDGGLEISGKYADEVIRLDAGQTNKLHSISGRAISEAERLRDFAYWQSVKRLCDAVQSELDGDRPINSVDTRNTLDEVQKFLRGD